LVARGRGSWRDIRWWIAVSTIGGRAGKAMQAAVNFGAGEDSRKRLEKDSSKTDRTDGKGVNARTRIEGFVPSTKEISQRF
jgi:hypothetical protein